MAAPGEHGALSARTVLEVADGLRWADPRLGAALAEHALRLAGDDERVRAAAERSVIRSLAEVDRFDEVVSRAAPLLDAALEREDREEVGGLLAELAAAAVGIADDALTARLVEPIGSDTGLPGRTVGQVALVRAQLAGNAGDVAAADREAEAAATALRDAAEPENGLVQRDLARARAIARRRSGDPESALALVVGVVSGDPAADPDGGRRALLAAAEEVELLLDLGRRDEALARAHSVLPTDTAAPAVVCPTARIRLALAEHVHLAGGAHTEAQALARVAATELESAGHEADAARAWEVVAAAAEGGGELGAALAAVRHAHELDSRCRDRRDPALRVLTMIAASVPELLGPPVRTSARTGGRTPSAPVSETLSEVETLLADARSSVTEHGQGSPLPRRRSHHRQDEEDDDLGPLGRSGAETVPEALARLLGTGSAPAGARPETPATRSNGSARLDGDGHLTAAGGERSSLLPTGSSPSSRHSAPGDEDTAADAPWSPPAGLDGPVPTFDTFPTTSRDAPHRGGGPEDPPREERGPAELPPWRATDLGDEDPTTWRCPDPSEFPHIDPADPLGSGSSSQAAAASPEGNAASDGADRAEPMSTPCADPANESPPAPTASGAPAPGRGDGRPPEGRDLDSRTEQRDAHPAVPSGVSAGLEPDDPDGELALTLAGLLAEYQLPDAANPTSGRDRADVAVPSARTHVSGSVPVPATDQRFTSRPGDAPDPVPSGDGTTDARGRRRENGARLADLLAEAMEAFRHTAPEEGSAGTGDARGSGVGSRRR